MAISFSLPIIPSFSKTTPDKAAPVKLWDGSVTQQILFIPDVKVLVKFAQGDLGIADSIQKSMIMRNMGKMNDISQLETFTKATGANLSKPLESYVKTNPLDGSTKIEVDPKDLSVSKPSGSLGGLSAMEKAMVLSIFETQKPYMEVFKLVTQNLVSIEDIISRVLGVSGKSMKPTINPKALGYKGNSELSSSLFKLENLISLKSGPKNSNINSQSSTPESNTSVLPNNFSYVTQSVIYSTGQFDPNVDYTYIYVDEKDDTIKLPDGTASFPQKSLDELPQYVIFGVYDSNWNPVPQSRIDLPLQEAKKNGTIDKNINWIQRSGKWFGQFQQIKENIDYNYVRDNNNNILYYGDEGPSVEVEGTTTYVKKGFPKLSSMVELTNYYKGYYLDDARNKMVKRGLSASVIDSTLNEISIRLELEQNGSTAIQSTIEGTLKNGFLPITTPLNTPGLNRDFTNAKYPFKPKKIQFQNQDVWLNPEAKYDMKIIKCDSSKDISYLDIEGDNKKFKKTQILRFVKNNISFRLSNDGIFNVRLTKNSIVETVNNTASFEIDNYDIKSSYQVFIYLSQVPSAYSNEVKIEIYDNYIVKYFNRQIDFGYEYSDSSGTVSFRSIGLNNLLYYVNLIDNKFPIVFPNGETLLFNTSGSFFGVKAYLSNVDDFIPSNGEYTRVTINSNNFSIGVERGNLPANSIRVQDDRFKFGKLISNTQIQNEQLAVNRPYSKNGLYGTPVNKNQNIEQIYRYMQTEDDTETYFIVEGILSASNTQKLNDGSSGQSGNGSGNQPGGSDDGYYSFIDVIDAIPVFIDMLIDVFAQLIPSITKLISLITNPPKFVTDILIAKLGDNSGTEPERFGFFSKRFQDDLKQLASLQGEISNLNNSSNIVDKQTINEQERIRNRVSKMNDYVKNSKLNNYVYVNEEGNPKFILDGLATVKLFGDAPVLLGLSGLKFGLETKLGSLATTAPEAPIKLVLEGKRPSTSKTKDDLSGLTKPSDSLVKQSALYNTNFEPKLDIPSKIETEVGGIKNIEEVSIQYSTGVFREDVDYNYVYVTDYVKKLLDEAQELEDRGEISKAINKLDEASKIDPQNQFIKDKKDLLSKLSEFVSSQPILDFMLNVVTLPLKVVLGIIKYIMDVFKSFTDPFELPGKIVEFVSFKWMLDFFSPASKNSMFAMAGLLFDVQTFLTVWLPSLETGAMDKFDLNKIIKLPWVPKLPTYDKDQFRTLIYGLEGGGRPRMIPLMFLNSILFLIEAVINSFVDLIWGIVGLGSLIPPPHIRLSKNNNGDLSPKDIMDLLNGEYFDDEITKAAGVIGKEPSYNFVYNIKTSDGRDVRDLNRVELDKWIEENKDLQFIFNV